MRPLPAGLVTFVFTDIEGSTRLHQRLGDAFVPLIAEHDGLLGRIVDGHGGVVMTSMGDGMFVVFDDAGEAVAAAVGIQEAVADHVWPDGATVRVRIGMHSAVAEPLGRNYVALAVHQAARVSAVAHGGQVVVTDAVVEAAGHLAEPVMALGEHRLKDFDDPVALHQVGTGHFPPLATVSNTNLPRPASSFVGRRHEVADLVERLRRGSRLVSVTGPGGSGKTRLAIEAATELVGDVRAGVFWVDLSQVREPERVLEVVAATLGATASLPAHIGERELLLVLDNLEQVVAAAPALAQLVEACPHLRLLVTSRERLRVRGETAYPVRPLTTADAAALFRDRAGLEADAEVERLCEALDNLPLALELAAARVGMMSVEQVLARLGSRLDAFTGGRDADPRQATLRATLEWSHALLDAGEKELFARLSVFAGGGTLDAVEAVARADLDGLQSLVNKSLLQHQDDRFTMLEVIRELAHERLAASAETATLRARHAQWFMALAEQERAGPGGVATRELIAQQHADSENFRLALEWALEQHEPCGMATADSLILAWKMHGRHRGLADWYRRALARWPSLEPPLRAQALTSYGTLLLFCEEHGAAQEALGEAVQLHRTAGDHVGEIHALNTLGSAAFFQGDPQRSLELHEQALRLARDHRYERGVSRSLHLIGETLAALGDLDRGVAALESAAETDQRLGDRIGVMTSLHSLGDVHLDKREPDRAERHYLDALRIAHEHDDLRSDGYCLAGLACVAVLRGDLLAGGRLWRLSLAVEERVGQAMLSEERARYERVLGPAGDDPLFRRGLREAERVLPAVVVAELLRA